MSSHPLEQPRDKPLKILYAGVKGCGKSANLEAIVRFCEKPEMRGLVSITDYSLDSALMDFLLLDITPRFTSSIRVNLYAMSPTLHGEITRDVIAGGVDGIVLVVDSEVSMLPTNMEALREVSRSIAIADSGRERTTPVVIQYNKRDVGERLPIRYLQSQLNLRKYPWVASVAGKGRGVLTTFRKILTAAMEKREMRVDNSIGLF